MKAIIFKDFYITLKSFKIIPFVFAVFYIFIFGHTMDVMYTALFAALLCVFMPMLTAGHDARTKWNVYAATFPTSRRDTVLSKYIYAAVFSFAVPVLYILYALIYTLILSPEFMGDTLYNLLWSYITVMMFLSVALALMLNAIFIPLILKLGARIASTLYILTVMLFFVFTAMYGMQAYGIFGNFWSELYYVIYDFCHACFYAAYYGNPFLSLLPVLGGLIIYILSCLIAVKLFSKKDIDGR